MVDLTVTFASGDDLRRELEGNLRGGGCFVADASGLAQNDLCQVTLVHPESGELFPLAARVVYVAPEGGVGVAFEGFSPDLRAELQRFVDMAPDAEAPEPEREPEPEPEPEPQPETEPDEQARPETIHERLRNLSPAEQIKLAREGELQERIVLERLYGKGVWPTLLANPRLTIGEVVRIARMHNLPQPQLEQLVGNPAWLHSGEVRRALLGNPRLGQDLMMRVLRALPKNELKIVPQQTSYPLTVRTAAKRLIGTER